MKGEEIETINDIKLLGTRITIDLRWNENTKMIVKSSNKRMQFLHRAAKFTNNVKDLKLIYMLQIRSKLEQSAVVWHSGLTQKNRMDLERVQKSALMLVMVAGTLRQTSSGTSLQTSCGVETSLQTFKRRDMFKLERHLLARVALPAWGPGCTSCW